MNARQAAIKALDSKPLAEFPRTWFTRPLLNNEVAPAYAA